MRADPSVLWAMVVATVLRVLPLALWGSGGCVRDECTYRSLAIGIVEGRGLASHEGWLWAPGWPYLLAAVHAVTGSVYPARALQVVASVLALPLLAAIVTRVSDARAGRIAAWMMALHATMAWYATSLFSEVVYTTLLLAAVLALLWSRDGGVPRAAFTGMLVGVCVLFRGVATYMGPIFAVVVCWPGPGESFRDGLRARWMHALALGVAMALTVAPYSVHATRRHGGFVLSDATLGQMLWLGDNDFPPMAFDWGTGQLEGPVYRAYAERGRPHCDKRLPAAAWDRCERERGLAWIRRHPGEFVRRIPVRLSQLVTPHTFLTRHVRSGKWPGLPFELEESLMVYVTANSFAVILGGGAAGFLRGRGPFAVLAGGIVLYHMLAIAVLAGLSRYRIPLEPFGIAFLAMAVSDGRVREWVAAAPVRAVLAALWIAVFLPLMLWTLPAGFPGWW